MDNNEVTVNKINNVFHLIYLLRCFSNIPYNYGQLVIFDRSLEKRVKKAHSEGLLFNVCLSRSKVYPWDINKKKTDWIREKFMSNFIV